MSVTNNVSPRRPLITGVLVGLLIGLGIGLFYAWQINPVEYAGGAFPHELNDSFKSDYVSSVAESYLTNRDTSLAANRLRSFSVEEKVSLLSQAAANFTNRGATIEADGVADLAKNLNLFEGWAPDAVNRGLQSGAATQAFAEQLGMVPTAGQTIPVAQPPVEEEASTGGWLRTLLIGLLAVLVVVIGFLILTQIKPKRQRAAPRIDPDMAAGWDGSGPQPLRTWTGQFTIGQDAYDESFTVETAEGDFLGECGMGILEGFASGSPKKVIAVDVWLFDKTDIRTVSVPVMSKFAFEDDVLRNKLPPDSNPVLAAEGQTFEIETTALLVKAKIDEVVYGEDKPEMSYFDSLKVSLTAFLKPDVDVSGTMPIPDQFQEA